MQIQDWEWKQQQIKQYISFTVNLSYEHIIQDILAGRNITFYDVFY